MAHMAITDVQTGRFVSAERFSRDGLMLAGNSANPFRLWIEDWAATAAGPDPFPLRLRADTGDASLDLNLAATKPPIGHGDRGLDAKGPQSGNASYYYSMPRLSASGALRIGDMRYAVSGSAWLDREWSTSALDPTLAGWDWLALELSDGRDLMLYRLRTNSGGSSPYSTGSLIAADGTVTTLGPADFELEAHTYWTSPATEARYPVGWNVNLPRDGLRLDIRALVPNQEMNLAVRYWEGAVSARGSHADSTVTGRGYLELTGY
jgi:predicted secreted hydrolase